MELPDTLLGMQVQRGSILLSNSFEDIDHAKFFVVIGVYDRMVAGFFFINSRIHPVVQSKPEQFAMQYQLRKQDYAFLRYDSFLGADELLTRPVGDLVRSIREGQTSFVGRMTDSDMDAILEACRNSKLFSPKEKRRFFY